MTEGTDTTTVTPDTSTVAAPVEASNPEITSPDNETVSDSATPEAESSDADNAEGEASDADKPKRLSRTQRLQRKNQYLQTKVLNLEEQIAELSKPKERPADDDFVKQIENGLDDRLRAQRVDALKEKVADIRAEMNLEADVEFDERVSAARKDIADFESVLKKFGDAGGKFSPHVSELIRLSELGPKVGYYLAKNPAAAERINNLPLHLAAKEFGRIEDTLSRSPSRLTKAPPPLKSPAGGTAPPQTVTDLAKSDDVSAYVALRRQQRNARA